MPVLNMFIETSLVKGWFFIKKAFANGLLRNHYFYEKHHMPKSTLPVGLFLLFATGMQAQQNLSYDTARRFAADAIQHSIRNMVRELGLKHPGFYRYHSKESFARYVDSVNATITDSLTEMQVYRKLKPIISHVGCLHTG